MHEPFDYTAQPEFAGPMTEPRATTGAALDIQALAQHSVRLPRLNQAALAAGEFVPVSAPSPYIDHDPEFQARERAEAYRRDLRVQRLRDVARTAARDAVLADTLTGQVLADVDGWVDAAMQPASAPVVIEPAAPVSTPAPEPEVRAAEPDPPPASSAEPAEPDPEPAAVRPRQQPKEDS
jgi:hypothetical protein